MCYVIQTQALLAVKMDLNVEHPKNSLLSNGCLQKVVLCLMLLLLFLSRSIKQDLHQMQHNSKSLVNKEKYISRRKKIFSK